MSRSRTTTWLRAVIAALTTLAAAALGTLVAAPPAAAASLQQITNFGVNPTGTKMFLYVPDSVKPNPAVLVGVHWCHGTAQDFYQGTGYASLADRYGFIVIYPSAPSSDGCWDVHSTASLTHNGGGDSLGIVSMVNYVRQRYGADPDRTFVTGHSSGGMMTNVLLGAYPDVFRAGSAYAGVPFGCFAGPDPWNSACANGQISRTPQQWGDAVRAAYPGYSGARPRMQLWHGTTDDVLRFANFGEEIKQWTNVHGVSQTPTSTEQNQPRSGWTRTRYGSQVEAIQETGQPHNLQILADQTIHFFGLDATSPTTPPSTSTWRGQGSGRCLDVPGGNQANGTRPALWDCNGGSNQNWTSTSSNELRTAGGKCLDVAGGATTDGTTVQIWDCNGGVNQQWRLNSDGTVVAVNSGRCLDVTGAATANGSPVQIWNCNGGSNQRWARALPALTGNQSPNAPEER
ncbi:PHB depolymerase family esterase [Actinoplanes sp. NPDC026623]|uniref:extracellular catalytic domain type 1 short-chain-length polyhydroxyalkanoate depolymerase n=1 Tax=Actinoplanes sp. NPDC026623 TaxID=3155610 RepID=UPI0033F6384F